MFMHPEDFYLMEKARYAELFRQRELERSVRAARLRKARHWGIGGAPARGRHAVTALFINSRQASATARVQGAAPVIASGSTARSAPN